MSKYLKRYNEETNKWELISAPDVSVVQKLEDGSDITDTNVVITNVNYINESGETNLDETLTVISDDISRLQRNVSWLAEHGGGGGSSSGGGGGTASFGIVVVSPILTDGSAYVTGKTFEIEFMITGGTDGEECQYSYTYDSNTPTDYAPIATGASVKIPIDNTGSASKEHSVIIRAKNPYGTNITPKTFRIYESTLSIAFDTNKAGDDYKFGIYNIRKDSTYADIPLLITNGLMRSDTVIVAKCADKQFETEPFINKTTDEQQYSISLWKLFPNKDVTVGEYYVISFQASATLGTNTIISNEIQLRALIISPTQISIVLGVNGTSGEIVDAPLRSSLVYNFKVYTPALVPPVESTYYSAKIHNDTTGEDYLILGKYYDETLKEEGATYSNNNSALVGRTISSQVFLDSEKFHVNDIVHLFVKTWDMTGASDRIASASTEIHIGVESNEVFPRQYNNRSTSDPYNTIFLSWNNENALPTSPNRWTSRNTNYGFLDPVLAESEEHVVIADINVLDGNSASVIKTDGQTSYLRLQNRAYGVADLTRYSREVSMMTAEDNNLYGFTVSFTLQIDNHNDTKHTVLLWGQNNADGTLANGIRIDTDKAQWVVKERKNGAIVTHNLSCHISSESRLTVDFSYVRNTSTEATARIYVNGILNAATDLEIMSPQYVFPELIYFGANSQNGRIERFSDIDIYEFSVYTKSLNDMQVSINGKNARFVDVDDYNLWKAKNFISSNEIDPRIPESVFFNNGKYITDFDTQQINNIAARSKIPTLYLNFPGSSNFTTEYFYAKQTSSAQTFDATATYYDPDSKRDASFRVKASLQGTSTLGYRIKNLELYVNETFVKDGETYVKLFQPKKEWLPESQFTLKADVVDSAHANNAILGEWINTSGIFQDNPAMQNYGENRPQDWDDAYSAATTDAERRAHTYTDDPEVATIKHTLEGFPFLMFIKFSDKSSYTFLGIYSFNLGRYSYYNMGMKFLKGYSRREGATKVACPKIINYYEEMPTLGNISASNVFSFEMGNAGNLKIADYPVWSQYDRTVVQSYGSFRYMGSPEAENAAWTNLCALFEAVAKFEITKYNGTGYEAYKNIKYYTIDASGNYQTTGREIEQSNEFNTQIVNRLSIENAVAYFIVANAFGMTDSLGKNLTIRTWDGGQKWWFCFYDMDTALALANDGSENNPITVAIDKVTMVSENSSSELQITYHDNDSKYAAVLSKIWGIFRDDQFLYLQNRGQELQQRYEYVWNALRSSTGKLSSSENFTNIMAARVDACGEMIYNYDYNTKYIQDTAVQDNGAAAAITFLHGTRVEYVKDWLRKHFYFLDGMFDYSVISRDNPFTYIDSPYNADVTTIVANYSSAIPVLPFTVQVSAPSFIGLGVGSDAYKKYYIDTENVDTTIYFVNGTSSNSQLNIKGSSILCKFNGLQGGFQAISDTNQTGVMKTLSTFDASSSNALNNNPFHSMIFGLIGEPSLESVNLSGTRGVSSLAKYEVDLSKCQKLIDVNIANSDVTALILPETTLQRLSLSNSNILNFNLSNQNTISEINLNGCDKLSTINIDGCNAIERLEITNKPNLSSISISNCNALTAITISKNYALANINLSNNQNLKSITIEDCENPLLSITIVSPSLESITLQNLSEMTNTIVLPNKENLSNVTALTISNCYKINGVSYVGSEEELYNEKPVFDLSPFTNVRSRNLKIRNAKNIEYIRVANDDGESPAIPLKLNRDTFYGCSNLTRIFGYIEISESSIFDGFPKFFINHEGYTPGDGTSTPPFIYYSANPYYTNVKITATQLDYCFSNTSCDISDAYYILQLCNEDVLSLKGLFSNCSNIQTSQNNPLNENMFSKCINVENIDSIFNGSCYIGGELSERLLSPLIDNLTTFNDVFAGQYTVKTTECFFPVGCKIKSITSFNPQASAGSYHRDNKMLTNLTELEEIVNSFNDCNIDFTMGERWDATELFKYNTKLLKIDSSFREIIGYGSLGNIFGGESDDTNFYPRSLSSVTASFTIKGGDHAGCTLYDGDNGAGVLLPLGNSFLKSIANSIVYITGNKPGQNYTYGAFNGKLNHPSFCGEGILKYLDNFDYSLPKGPTHQDDCNGEDFPYDIFDGCLNLKEFPSLFEEVHNFKNANGTVQDILINIPGRLFDGCRNIENVSKMFYNMYGGITCKLTANSFIENKIINADYIFGKEYNYGRFNLTEQIPYKLFYQRTIKSYATTVGITEEQADSLGIYDESGNTAEPITISTTFSGNYADLNKTIATMQYAFVGIDSTSMTPYYAVINSWEELVEDNPNYNPIKYFVDGTYYEMNPHYDPYKKVWNKYVYDNSVNFYEYISQTNIESIRDEYGNPIVDMAKLPDEFKQGHTMSPQATRIGSLDIGTDDDYSTITDYEINNIFAITNYMFAPDVFKYCVNSTTTNANYAFSRSSGIYSGGTIQGLHGTLPEFVFEPINTVLRLVGIFDSCMSIFPHYWKYVENDVEHRGETYPPLLFNNMPNLYDISRMFAGGRIWGKTTINDALFAGCSRTLRNVSALWKSAIWIDRGNEPQLPSNIFNACSNLTSASEMLANSGGYCVKIISQILTPSFNPNLSDCSSFLYNATNTTGMVPAFWDWSSYQLNSYHYALRGVPQDSNIIYNYTPERFDKFIRDN